ncbi:uncharacterized protein LOC130894163 isoform X2 [Diorhabda carinulata]|uniref:uncharacterized protein LOC130894163 isoform X2 n=1 Tax=Diorhabda carinulata TaxID=1163345 RepID=UPI0025A04EC7|nr:uncharacterized protein LOC130894163 isoform X2 [Diorhabda carinulata]
MKVTNNLFFLCLGATTLGAVLGAPRAIKNDEDLEKSVVEFLSHDKQFLSALQHSGLIDDPELTEKVVMKRDAAEEENNETLGFFKRVGRIIMKFLVEKIIETAASYLFG